MLKELHFKVGLDYLLSMAVFTTFGKNRNKADYGERLNSAMQMMVDCIQQDIRDKVHHIKKVPNTFENWLLSMEWGTKQEMLV